MRSFTPTPFLAPTHSDPDLAPLRSESALYRSQQPSSPSIGSATTLRTGQPRLTSTALAPERPSQLSTDDIQSPYIHRANGLLQIAVSTPLRTDNPVIAQFRVRSAVDTALEIYHQARFAARIAASLPRIRELGDEEHVFGDYPLPGRLTRSQRVRSPVSNN
jgi:hypothetical protein